MQKTIFQCGFFIFILMYPIFCYALTPQQVIDLKKAGVSDQTIQMMIEQEEKAQDPHSTMGTKEIKDKDGNTEKKCRAKKIHNNPSFQKKSGTVVVTVCLLLLFVYAINF